MRLRLGSFITSLAAAALVAAAAGGTVARARQADSAEAAFEAARRTEVVDHDLRGAMAKYRDIASRFSSNRTVAANALARLAACYEQLGQPEAQATYQRIVREFGDVPAVTAVARTKVAALRPARPQREGLAPRRLLSVQEALAYSVSPDGLRAVYTENFNLVMYDLSSGQRTVLVPGSATSYAAWPLMSGDGRRIAYRAVTPGITGDSLMVMGMEPGSKGKLLSSATGLRPIAWTADGQSVLALETTVDQGNRVFTVVRVSAADGTTTPVRSLGTAQARPMSTPRLSPDGRFLAYSSVSGSTQKPAAPPDSPHRIFIASLDSSAEVEAVTMAGSHTDPVWTPDGGHLLFTSTRAMTKGLWSVGVQNGAPIGAPTVVRPAFDHTLVAVPSTGALLYSDTSGGGFMNVIVERGAGRVLATFPGGGLDWSPDGRSFAFKGSNSVGSEVIVRSTETGAERALKRDNTTESSPHWLGNNRMLVQVQGDAPGTNAVHVMDVDSGTSQLLYANQADGFVRQAMATSDDGRMAVAVYRKPGQLLLGIVTIDPVTGKVGPPAPFPEPLEVVAGMPPGIDLSLDGSRVAIMWKPTPTTARVATMRIDGTEYRELAGPFPAQRTPDLVRWTPDGRSVLYLMREPNRSRVMRIPAEGGTPEVDTVDIPGPIFTIDPSPDGSRLSYNTYAPQFTELWSIDNILVELGR
jgi:Tol biopolymer transport system component